MRIDAAQEMPPPSPEVLGVRPTSSYTTSADKEEIYAAVAAAVAEELPAGAVRLQLSFLVGPDRKWWHLWKPTIDSLEPLLGRDASEQRAWHPLDGRITELGMHKTVDPAFRYEVEIGIAAQPAREPDTTTPGLGSASGLPLTKGKSVARKRWTVSDTCRFADAVIDNDGRDLPAEKLDALSDEVHCSRGAAETMVWRMQTVLGYPVKAAETSVLDRAVGQLFLDHDPRLRRQVNV
jgi:hypothetical protein